MLLRTVNELKSSFKPSHIIAILRGISSNNVKKYKHTALETFGLGKDSNDHFWGSVIQKALVENFLYKEVESFGTVKIAEKGLHYLIDPTPFYITLDHQYPDDDSESISVDRNHTEAFDQELFGILKKLNKEIAKSRNLPPYIVFPEASLQDMCTQYPITTEELKNIVGVGQGKARKFGKPFLEAIHQYVKENDIERPSEMVVKSLANKSINKIFIIQSIDRKMSLEDIANAKGWEVNEVLNQIENIVDSGTKVNLNYYIDEVLDEYQQEEVIDYFKGTEKDCLESALDELGQDEYTLEDLRLMRVKFISDLGN